ncbi:TPA: hypothetical protein ACVU00_003516 [Vibrio cholerae]|uniref:hypothetical protein n=1 Tax=Vibrio TaxID=662 RepID=UPI002080901A|nr:hypothetical protein [Vibrio sp. 1262-1]EJL9435192.1 hypothetical protein [Vibrio cholerae]MDW2405143.1 hypothetical protein [Vibrio sp. 1262-1]GHY03102.1 hypothetical protein VCSRO161_3625 [Vibrio cholerae]HDL9476521.1 hypothetical protein [Vibrio cholerae]
MKKVIPLIFLVTLSGCAGLKLDLAKHGERINLDDYKESVVNSITVSLKDPDSLKNLHLFERPCLLTTHFRNVIEDSESWCITATYQATNSYGGYVPGNITYYIDKQKNLIPTFLNSHGLLETTLGSGAFGNGNVEFPSDNPSTRY